MAADVTVDFPTDPLDAYTDDELEAYAANLQETADKLKEVRRAVAGERSKRVAQVRIGDLVDTLSPDEIKVLVESIQSSEGAQSITGAGGVSVDAKKMGEE